MTDSPSPERKHSRSHWPLAFALIAITAIAVGGYLYSQTLGSVEKVLDLPQKAADGLARIFGSEVEIDNNSFTVGDQGIAELALVERKLITTTKYESSFLGNKATAIIKGVYRVKTGYDLDKDYTIEFDETNSIVRANLPEPEILSIETESQEVFYLDQSLLNKIDPDEWQDAYAKNREAAELEVANEGLLEETRRRFLERAADLLGGHGLSIEAPKP